MERLTTTLVTGTNSAGTSPNSAELAATPIVPPTFTSSATAAPNPVTQGVGTTIKATVNCTANTLTNGNIQIQIVDPNGNTAATQNYSSQNFASAAVIRTTRLRSRRQSPAPTQ